MERLRQLRMDKGVTQRALADYLGVDRTTYVKYENGQSVPNISSLLMLSQYFDVSVDYLLENTNTKKALSSDRAAFPKQRDILAGNLKRYLDLHNFTAEDLPARAGIDVGEIESYLQKAAYPSPSPP